MIPGTPKKWDPLRDSYGTGIGSLPQGGPIIGGSLKIPLSGCRLAKGVKVQGNWEHPTCLLREPLGKKIRASPTFTPTTEDLTLSSNCVRISVLDDTVDGRNPAPVDR